MSVTIRLLYDGDAKNIIVKDEDLYDTDGGVVCILNLLYIPYHKEQTPIHYDPASPFFAIDLRMYERAYITNHTSELDLGTRLDRGWLTFRSGELEFLLRPIDQWVSVINIMQMYFRATLTELRKIWTVESSGGGYR